MKKPTKQQIEQAITTLQEALVFRYGTSVRMTPAGEGNEIIIRAVSCDLIGNEGVLGVEARRAGSVAEELLR